MLTHKRSLLLVSGWLLLQIVVWLSTVAANVPPNSDFPTKPIWNGTWTDKLKTKILHKYDQFSRPSLLNNNNNSNNNNATVVTVGLTVLHVDVNEMTSAMEVHCWVKMFWTDERLQWNSSDYTNLTVLRVADHEIWKPDVVIYNSFTDIAEENYGHVNCLVYPTGEIIWVPPSKMQAICQLDLRHWPFDTQTCSVKMMSSSYTEDHIDLQLQKIDPEFQLLTHNTEWQIEKVSHFRTLHEFPEGPRVEVFFHFTIKRCSSTYSAVVVTPAIVIVMMTLAVFWLPPTSGEKIFLSGSIAITISLFLLSFAKTLPAMKDPYSPLIVMFYSRSLFLVCLSLAVSVTVLNLSRLQHIVPVPKVVKGSLGGVLGKWLGLGYGVVQVPLSDSVTGNNAVNTRDPVTQRCSRSNRQDWVMVATAIDRIAFLAYCFLFLILAVTYYV